MTIGSSLVVKWIVKKSYDEAAAEYEMINRRLHQKYQMSLEEFEQNNMLEKLNYSFEAESDYHDWDMAADGIASLHCERSETISFL